MQTGQTTRLGKVIALSKCQLRQGSKFKDRSAGAVWAMCTCGMVYPPRELPDSENTRMVMYYILQIMEGFDYNERVVVFDDMCHLLR